MKYRLLSPNLTNASWQQGGNMMQSAHVTTKSARKPPSLMRGMKCDFLVWGRGGRLIGRIVPRQVGIEWPADDFRNGQVLGSAPLFQLLFLSLGNVDIRAFFAHILPPSALIYNSIRLYTQYS